MAKDKKYKGGPDRKSYIRSMARQGGRPMGEYTKYGDVSPKEVHTGDATLMRNTFADDASTSIGAYGRAVKTGHGKSYFRFQGKLYKTTNSSGTTSEEVQI